VKRVHIVALLAGFAADLFGTFLFSAVISVFFVASHVQRGERLEAILPKVTGNVPLMLIGFLGGMLFTLLGAYITARLSKPDCVLNTFLFGLISTLGAFLFISINPLWYTVLCVLTLLPVSLIPGYLLQAKAI
jgi:Na+/H+-translocating membrane pyrophosphatase